MAKLGMPSVNIAFTEAGIEAIERSQRGIVALILEEPAATITELLAGYKDGDEDVPAIKNPFTVYTSDDIPEKLTDDNKDYIKKTLLGYQTTPYRVKVYLQPTVTKAEGDATDPNDSADKFAKTLDTLATDRWDYLAIPTITDKQTESVGTWLKTNRENKFKRAKVVLPNYSGDYEGIINFTNTKIVTKEKEFTTAEYCSRVAGIIAGTPMTISCTYAPVNEVIEVENYTKDEMDAKVGKGEFFFFNDGEKIKVARGVNSFVTTMQGKGEDFKKIKLVDIMDMIHDDIKKTGHDSYIGKYANSYDNRCLLITAIQGYLDTLETEGLLERNQNTVSIDIQAVKNWRESNGLNTKAELAVMKDQTIKELNIHDNVFLAMDLSILDAIDNITVKAVVQ